MERVCGMVRPGKYVYVGSRVMCVGYLQVRVKNVFEPVCQKLNHFSETVYEILKISLVAVSFLILGPSSYCLFQYQSKSIFSLANCWLNPFSFDVEVDTSLFFSCFREKN